MTRPDESFKHVSEVIISAVRQTGTRLQAITRNRMQALNVSEDTESQLARLKQLSEREVVAHAVSSRREKLRDSFMSGSRSVILRSREGSGRKFWKTGERESFDTDELVRVSQYQPAAWDEE